jgi:topoisomerase-4 subunit A
VFLDSTGRAYSLPAHALPSARGQGEPLSGRLDPPDGASFPGVLIGEPGDRWVVASGAGYGFVVRLGELHSRNRSGKAILKVPEGSSVLAPASVPAVENVLLAAVNSDGRLLTFPVADLPELPRGKGNKIFGISSKKAVSGEEALVAIAAVAPGQSLRVLSGERHMGLSYRELGDYRGERGQRGAVLPRGWRKVEGLEVDGG